MASMAAPEEKPPTSYKEWAAPRRAEARKKFFQDAAFLLPATFLVLWAAFWLVKRLGWLGRWGAFGAWAPALALAAAFTALMLWLGLQFNNPFD